MDDISNDRRKFKRISFISNATLINGNQQYDIQIIDLSLKGIHFCCDANIDLSDSSYQVILYLDDAHQKVISMNVTLSHHQANRYGGCWQQIDVDSFSNLKKLLTLNLGSDELITRELSELIYP